MILNNVKNDEKELNLESLRRIGTIVKASKNNKVKSTKIKNKKDAKPIKNIKDSKLIKNVNSNKKIITPMELKNEITEAEKLMKNNNIDESEKKLLDILNSINETDNLYYNTVINNHLGIIYAKKGELVNSIHRFTKVLVLDKDNDAVKNNLIKICRKLLNLNINEVDKSLIKDVKNDYTYARQLFIEGDYERLEPIAFRIIQDYDVTPETSKWISYSCCFMGAILNKQQQFDNALNYYIKAIKLYDNNTQAEKMIIDTIHNIAENKTNKNIETKLQSKNKIIENKEKLIKEKDKAIKEKDDYIKKLKTEINEKSKNVEKEKINKISEKDTKIENEQIKKLEKENKQYKSKIDKLEKENSKFLEKIDNMKKEMQNLKDKGDQYREQFESLTNQLENFLKMYQELSFINNKSLEETA